MDPSGLGFEYSPFRHIMRIMKSFRTTLSFPVDGRGRLFTTKLSESCPRSLAGFHSVYGENVIINGHEFYVKGFDTYGSSAEVCVGEIVGLLVDMN